MYLKNSISTEPFFFITVITDAGKFLGIILLGFSHRSNCNSGALRKVNSYCLVDTCASESDDVGRVSVILLGGPASGSLYGCSKSHSR